jgi:hypothetical protein
MGAQLGNGVKRNVKLKSTADGGDCFDQCSGEKLDPSKA